MATESGRVEPILTSTEKECKTLREVTPEGSGTTVMYQNLILRLLSTEGDVNVTSLKIYDEIENPITITQH